MYVTRRIFLPILIIYISWQNSVGVDNNYPIYVDYHTSTTCFITAGLSKAVSSRILNEFQSAGLVNEWLFIPHQLKLDPALVKMQQYVKSLEDSVKMEDTGKYNDKDITVLYGLGVRNMGMNGLEISKIIEVYLHIFLLNLYLMNIQELKYRLSQYTATNAFESILRTSNHDSSSGRMWATAYEDVRSFDTPLASYCNFNNLIITNTSPSSISLHNVRETVTTSACIATLLAILIQSPGASNVYLESRPVLLNYYGGQTMETGSVTGGRPFSDRGLNGTGQIIGHCDSGIDLYSCYFRDQDYRPVC